MLRFLIESRGISTLTQKAGQYLVIASAAVFLADILRAYSEFNMKEGEPAPEPRRELLFSGGINIFEEGEILGTDLRGYTMNQVGEIWTATPNLEASIENVLFGTAVKEQDRILVVERILAGYDKQDEYERSARHRRDVETFRLGREQGEVDSLGWGL